MRKLADIKTVLILLRGAKVTALFHKIWMKLELTIQLVNQDIEAT